MSGAISACSLIGCHLKNFRSYLGNGYVAEIWNTWLHGVACLFEFYVVLKNIWGSIDFGVCTVVYWLACWIANREVRGSNPGHCRNLAFQLSFDEHTDRTLSACQLSFDEYTDRTLSACQLSFDEYTDRTLSACQLSFDEYTDRTL